jgi:hypothetical protein
MMDSTQTDSSAVALSGDSWAVASSKRTTSELRLILALAALLGVALESRLLQQGMAYAVATVYVLISLITL